MINKPISTNNIVYCQICGFRLSKISQKQGKAICNSCKAKGLTEKDIKNH
jgi:hypothetical protein